MRENLRITILGCGSSSGTPVIGCKCAICSSSHSYNKRTRASIIVRAKNTNILIDASPDLRTQCLTHNIDKIDAVICTHAHADHVLGLDDLKSFRYINNTTLPFYSDLDTLTHLKKIFGYIFDEESPYYSLSTNSFNCFDKITIGDAELQTFRQIHGNGVTTGIRIKDFAYSTDLNILPEESFPYLENLDLWVVDCLAYRVSDSHSNLENTLEWIKKFKPKRAILTHMCHELDYEELKSKLPKNVIPAYDGLIIDL